MRNENSVLTLPTSMSATGKLTSRNDFHHNVNTALVVACFLLTAAATVRCIVLFHALLGPLGFQSSEFAYDLQECFG
jgi:hypothetical protein